MADRRVGDTAHLEFDPATVQDVLAPYIEDAIAGMMQCNERLIGYRVRGSIKVVVDLELQDG